MKDSEVEARLKAIEDMLEKAIMRLAKIEQAVPHETHNHYHYPQQPVSIYPQGVVPFVATTAGNVTTPFLASTSFSR